MVLGLKVKFWNSCLVEVNFRREFMEMTCNFLNCSKVSILIKYLDLPGVPILEN